MVVYSSNEIFYSSGAIPSEADLLTFWPPLLGDIVSTVYALHTSRCYHNTRVLVWYCTLLLQMCATYAANLTFSFDVDHNHTTKS
jgi:hypothetical protein